MEKMEKRYRSLRVIAWISKLGAWVSFVCGFVMFFALLFGGQFLFHLLEGTGAALSSLEAGRVFGAVGVLVGFLLNALFLYALSSTIYLFIDIEANTRKTALLLSETLSSRLPPVAEPSDESHL